MDDLKPCPFCGSDATWKKTRSGWAVQCGQRWGICRMNARTHYQPHKEQAVIAWNTRAQAAEIERLRDLSHEAFEQLMDPPSLQEHGHNLEHFLETYGEYCEQSFDLARKLRAALGEDKFGPPVHALRRKLHELKK